jgi:hypothetical protein
MGKRSEQSLYKGRSPNGQKSHEEILTIPDYKRNANQITLRFYLTLVKMAIIKNTTNVGKDVGKRNPSTLLVGM